MTEPRTPPQETLHHEPDHHRDDHRPPGTPHAGIAPGQIDVDAALAATHDGAGEPLPSLAERQAQGLGARPSPHSPQPGSADTAPADHRTFTR